MFRLQRFTLPLAPIGLICLTVLLLATALRTSAADEYTYLYSLPEEEGASYALSGNTAVVSFDNETVKVYTTSSGGWVEQATLVPNRVIEDYVRYGSSIAIDGDTAVVTTSGFCLRYEEDPPDTPVSVFIFQRTGTTWTQQQELQLECDDSGNDVDISGTQLIVATAGSFDEYLGSVFFFTYNGTSWVSTGTFKTDFEPANSSNENDVAIDGNTAIVLGQPGEPDEEFVIRVYQFSGAVWSEQMTLPSMDTTPGSGGYSYMIDVDGNTIMIGNHFYVWNGSNWVLQQTVTIPTASEFTYFRAAIDGDYAVLNLNEGESSYLLKRVGTTWTPYELLIDGQPIDTFNRTVAISGNLLLVGPHTFLINDAPVDPTPTAVVTQEETPDPTFTPTPVVTDEQTPDPTSTPGATEEPTSTATPPTVGEPLNDNPSFEGNGLTGWTLKDATGDKLRCSTNKPVAHTGNCAFQFKNADKSGKLQQTVDFIKRAERSSTQLELSLFARTKGNATGEARVTVIYADGSKQKFGVDIADAGGGYMEFSETAALTQTNLSKAKIVIKGTNNRGKFFVDDITLSYVDGIGGFSVLPMPAN
jgi:hypothetical protein